LRLDPERGHGRSSASTLNGDTIHARFAIRSSNVHWTRDSTLANTTIGDLIWHTVSGISNLDVEARLSGAAQARSRGALQPRSGDRRGLRAVLGEQSPRRRTVRDRVDALINDKVDRCARA